MIEASTVICPACDTLLTPAAACPACGWQRPRAARPGGVFWRAAEMWGRLGERNVPALLLADAQRLILLVDHGYPAVQRSYTWVAVAVVDGRQLWRRPLPDNTFTTGGVLVATREPHDGLLIAPENSVLLQGGSRLVARSLRDGAAQWSQPVNAYLLSTPALLDDRVFAIAGRLHGVAFAAATGQPLWETAPLCDAYPPEGATAADGAFWVSARSRALRRVQADDGRVTTWAPLPDGLQFRRRAAWRDGVLYSVTDRDGVLALDTRRGALLWHVIPERGATTQPVVDARHVYVGSKRAGGSGYALTALDRATGAVVWQHGAAEHFYASPALADGLVFVAGCDGRLAALDAQSGAEQWAHPFDDGAGGGRAKSYAIPAVAGHLVLGGDVLGRTLAVAWRAEAPVRLPSAEELRIANKLELAALVETGNGRYASAARDFEALGRWYVAAQLYGRAGEWSAAAAAYARAERFGAAADAYERAGLPVQQAQMLLRDKRYAAAARVLAAVKAYAAAAEAFLQAGELIQAAEQHELAGDIPAAAQLYDRLRAPESKAALYERAGDIDAAVAVWRGIDQPRRAAALLAQHKRAPDAAALLEQEGLIDEAVAVLERAADWAGAAAVFERARRWVPAAALYERAGKVAEAARLYERGGELRKAAELYGRTSDTQSKAIAIYSSLNDNLEIAQLHERRGDLVKAADAYLAVRPPRYREAAVCFGKAREWRQAALNYEQAALNYEQAGAVDEAAGAVDKAAASWRQAGEPKQIGLLYERLGQPQRAADHYRAIGEWGEAARLYVALGQTGDAVAMYREAGNEQGALNLLLAAERWSEAAELAHALQLDEQEAQACERQVAAAPAYDRERWYAAAARAYQRAAEHAEDEPAVADERRAALWEQAQRCYRAAYDEQRVLECAQQIRRLRHRAFVSVQVQTLDREMLFAEQFNELMVTFRNQGHGTASLLVIRMRNTDLFEGGDLEATLNIKGLTAGQEVRRSLRVRPKAQAIGTSTPFDVELSYRSPDEHHETHVIKGRVNVVQAGSQHATPVDALGAGRLAAGTIIIHGDFVQANKEGDTGLRKTVYRSPVDGGEPPGGLA